MDDPVETMYIISSDKGKTWQPMPPDFRRVGRIIESSPDVVVQAVGRGQEIWYAVALKADVTAENG